MKEIYKELLSEFLGTFVMMLFGLGVVAMAVVFDGAKGNFLSITLAWGFAVMFGIFVGGYSGAHLNPAVSFALAATHRFPWKKVPLYALAQTFAAFLAVPYFPLQSPTGLKDSSAKPAGSIFR